MTHYKLLAIVCLIAFIILVYVVIFIEPKKYGPSWWALLIFISLFLIMSFVFLFMEEKEKNIKRVKYENVPPLQKNKDLSDMIQRNLSGSLNNNWKPDSKYVNTVEKDMAENGYY